MDLRESAIDLIAECLQKYEEKTDVLNWMKHKKNPNYGRRTGKLVHFTTDLDKLFPPSPDSSDTEDDTPVLNTQSAVNTANKLNLKASNRTDMVSDKECEMKNDEEECDMNKDESANFEENFSREKSASTLLISGSKLKLDGTKHGSFTEISSSVGQHTSIEKSAAIKKRLSFSENTSASQANQEPPLTFHEEVSINRPPTGTNGIKNAAENTKVKKHQHKVLMHSHLSSEKQISSTHKIFPEQKISAIEMKSVSFLDDEESDLTSFEDKFIIEPEEKMKLSLELEGSQKKKRDSKNKTLNSRHSVSSTKKVSKRKRYKNSVTESSNSTYWKRRKSYQSESSSPSPVSHKNRMKKNQYTKSSSSSFKSSDASNRQSSNFIKDKRENSRSENHHELIKKKAENISFSSNDHNIKHNFASRKKRSKEPLSKTETQHEESLSGLHHWLNTEVSINHPPTGTNGIENAAESTKVKKHQHKVLMHSHLSSEKQISSTHKIFPVQKVSAMEMKSVSVWDDEESDSTSFEDQFVIKPDRKTKLNLELEDSQKKKRDSKNKTLNSRHSVSSTKKVSKQKRYKNSVTESSNSTYSKRRKSYQSESSSPSPVSYKKRMKKNQRIESSSSSFQSSNACVNTSKKLLLVKLKRLPSSPSVNESSESLNEAAITGINLINSVERLARRVKPPTSTPHTMSKKGTIGASGASAEQDYQRNKSRKELEYTTIASSSEESIDSNDDYVEPYSQQEDQGNDDICDASNEKSITSHETEKLMFSSPPKLVTSVSDQTSPTKVRRKYVKSKYGTKDRKSRNDVDSSSTDSPETDSSKENLVDATTLTSASDLRHCVIKIMKNDIETEISASNVYSLPSEELPFSNTGQSWQKGDPVRFTKAVSTSLYAMGRMQIEPGQEKGLTCMQKDALCFFVAAGIVQVFLAGTMVTLGVGSYFHIPPGNGYNIKNSSTKNLAELHFVQVKLKAEDA